MVLIFYSASAFTLISNGRSTRTFLQLFALEHEQAIDYPLTNEAMIVAENEADVAKIALLIKVKALAE